MIVSAVTAFPCPVTVTRLVNKLSFPHCPAPPPAAAAPSRPESRASSLLQVLYYSTSLFTAAGLEEWQSKYATLGVGSVMVVMTLVSIPLMDRAGRRTLHLYGLGGMFIFSIFITISLLIKVCVFVCVFLSNAIPVVFL